MGKLSLVGIDSPKQFALPWCCLLVSAVQLKIISGGLESVQDGDGKHPEVTGTLELTGQELPSAFGKVIELLICEKMGKRIEIL